MERFDQASRVDFKPRRMWKTASTFDFEVSRIERTEVKVEAVVWRVERRVDSRNRTFSKSFSSLFFFRTQKGLEHIQTILHVFQTNT